MKTSPQNAADLPKAVALLALLALSAALAGCNASSMTPTPAPTITPVQNYPEPQDRYSNPGSIFSESSSNMLFEDNRARRIGDILLIKIVENTKAKHKADTTADRTSNIGLGVTSLLGFSSVRPLGVGGSLAGTLGDDPMIGAKSSSDLNATGETKRENYVTTTIGARIINVLPNNVLQIAGAREIQVNEETEYMVVTGLVRADDVLSDNSVLSTQLAESKISYYGKGALADKQKSGWLIRLLDNIWPF
ncbi:MAG: flagellar basal body L-ring protein FlgH [Deltaproteobacteria bacterium]|jgi:flagellar L-ring protein precursor FlgH|nr:flagellar basal body L-ring protein FlgH [Deltaproteobacteria bacterium]